MNIRGCVTLAAPPFGNFVKARVRTVPGIMHIKFEVCILLTTLEQLAFKT